MTQPHVLIAGGGIGGLSLALSLHQVGVPFTVFESARQLAPLGVGINLQPNAVRELYDMGIDDAALRTTGVPLREWALVGLNGRDIHSEPRGLDAGYNWPQMSVHRGAFHMLLLDELTRRAGPDVVQLGSRCEHYEITPEGVTVTLRGKDDSTRQVRGSLLIGADGIHSAIRAQMHPDQPPIHWGGAMMWRGTTLAKPFRSGASFIGLGTHKQRMVIYPITPADPQTGLARINWIAETTIDTASEDQRKSWFSPVEIDSFVHHFEHMRYDWLDVPALIRGADGAFENPMIDRDPVSTWVQGPVALLGDAAHPMYPTGSNGASQAIIDSRVLTAHILTHGITRDALRAYDTELCAPISDVVLRNRGAGPFGLLTLVDERCGGVFDDIETVLPRDEREAFLQGYKSAAGYEKSQLNDAPRRIPAGAGVDLSV